MRAWIKSGNPWVWLNAAAIAACLILVVGLTAVIAVRGLAYFWPSPVLAMDLRQPDGSVATVVGEVYATEKVPVERLSGGQAPPSGKQIERRLIKTGNRDSLGLDFRWIVARDIVAQRTPRELVVMERREWGDLYGELVGVAEAGQPVAAGEAAWAALQPRLERAIGLVAQAEHLQKRDMGALNYELEQLRLHERRLQLDDELTAAAVADIEARRQALQASFTEIEQRLDALYRQAERDSARVRIADGRELEVPLAGIVRAYQPNAMSLADKLGFYFAKLWEFVSDEPREANTEGGVFPAIFGTVAMVLLMTVVVAPFGVIAAIYLNEYARKGLLTRLIRVSVINLAGVPSIVYGVFGLGFFVYFLGGNIDDLFFTEAQPAPTFGTPGLLWASLTLALLTLPVVIVSTEEGLARIPRAIREGSLALGATKAETLWRTVIPMASPAIMTGLILSIARAAGEVAPLMLVGVVKLAPTLPVDLNAPFLHLDRQFMHLGFHIYDVGFQSPNIEAARPLVYATALLLVVIILLLNLFAIRVRNRLRERYRALEA